MISYIESSAREVPPLCSTRLPLAPDTIWHVLPASIRVTVYSNPWVVLLASSKRCSDNAASIYPFYASVRSPLSVAICSKKRKNNWVGVKSIQYWYVLIVSRGGDTDKRCFILQITPQLAVTVVRLPRPTIDVFTVNEVLMKTTFEARTLAVLLVVNVAGSDLKRKYRISRMFVRKSTVTVRNRKWRKFGCNSHSAPNNLRRSYQLRFPDRIKVFFYFVPSIDFRQLWLPSLATPSLLLIVTRESRNDYCLNSYRLWWIEKPASKECSKFQMAGRALDLGRRRNPKTRWRLCCSDHNLTLV